MEWSLNRATKETNPAASRSHPIAPRDKISCSGQPLTLTILEVGSLRGILLSIGAEEDLLPEEVDLKKKTLCLQMKRIFFLREMMLCWVEGSFPHFEVAQKLHNWLLGRPFDTFGGHLEGSGGGELQTTLQKLGNPATQLRK